MVNYAQAKIYKIVDNTNGNIYVGSTCEPTLARRLSGHVGAYKTYLNGSGSCITSFQILQNKNYEIVLLENCENIFSRDELKSRERHYIETLSCVNKNIPLRTAKEWKATTGYKVTYTQNKKSIYKYRETHIDKTREIQKMYKRKKDAWLKVRKEFLNILVDI
jgi:hypothetical protein